MKKKETKKNTHFLSFFLSHFKTLFNPPFRTKDIHIKEKRKKGNKKKDLK